MTVVHMWSSPTICSASIEIWHDIVAVNLSRGLFLRLAILDSGVKSFKKLFKSEVHITAKFLMIPLKRKSSDVVSSRKHSAILALVAFRAMTTANVDASLSSTWFDEFTWPMTQAEVFKCVIQMLQVLGKDVTNTSYLQLVVATQ